MTASSPRGGDPLVAGLSGVVLAAGRSRRAAPRNKLLLPAPSGRPVVRVVAEALCAAGLGEVIVVTGHQADPIAAAVAGLPVRLVHADEFELGLGHSVAAGIRAARADAAGFLVCPGDLPGMSVEIVREIASAFASAGGAHNIVPVAGGQRGHPVALVAALRRDLVALTGDQGARVLLDRPAEQARTMTVDVGTSTIHADNDTGAAG